ncbi:hypothetical protein K1719_020959 [Acacia pycnantha]|nr:hypothetical protein K1719_020959 [Acacia pycnantha]
MHRRLLDAGLTGSPADGNQTRESFVGDVNFDANMPKIFHRDHRTNSCKACLNGPEETSPEQDSGEGVRARVNIPSTECPICLGEFEKGDKVRMLPKCNHGFHVSCIDTWLLSHSSCPNCRHSLLEKSTNLNTNSNRRREGGGDVAGAQAPTNGSSGNGQVHSAAVVDE